MLIENTNPGVHKFSQYRAKEYILINYGHVDCESLLNGTSKWTKDGKEFATWKDGTLKIHEN